MVFCFFEMEPDFTPQSEERRRGSRRETGMEVPQETQKGCKKGDRRLRWREMRKGKMMEGKMISESGVWFLGIFEGELLMTRASELMTMVRSPEMDDHGSHGLTRMPECLEG